MEISAQPSSPSHDGEDESGSVCLRSVSSFGKKTLITRITKQHQGKALQSSAINILKTRDEEIKQPS